MSNFNSTTTSMQSIEECFACFASVGEADKLATAKTVQCNLTEEIVLAEMPEKLQAILTQLFQARDAAAFTIAHGITAHFNKAKHGRISGNLLICMFENPVPSSQLTDEVVSSVLSIYNDLSRCLKPDTVPVDKIWEFFCRTPSKYYNQLLECHSSSQRSQPDPPKEKLHRLSLIKVLIETFNKLPEEEKFQLNYILDDEMEHMLSIQKKDITKFTGLLNDIFTECLAKGIRKPWVISKNLDEGGRWVMRHIADGLDAEYDAMELGQPGYVSPDDRKITTRNLTIQEFLIKTFLQQSFWNQKLFSKIVEDHLDWILNRLEMVGSKGPDSHDLCRGQTKDGDTQLSGEDAECSCEFDWITNFCWKIMNALPQNWTRFTEDPSMVRRIAEIILDHPNRHRVDCLLNLYGKFHHEISPYLDRVINFLFTGDTERGSLEFSFLKAVATYDPWSLKPAYINACESFIIHESDSFAHVSDCISALEKVAENAPELMLSRGEGYYEAILRTNPHEHVRMWESVDNTIKCIALRSEAEAERGVNILIGGTQLIPAMSHRANVLEHMACIALVYPKIVKTQKKWIKQQGAVDFLKKSVVRLNLILSQSIGSGPLGVEGAGGRNTNESSTCAIS